MVYVLNSGKMKYLSRGASEKILENEMPGMRKEIPKEETYSKYGGARREKLKLKQLKNAALLSEFLLRKFLMGHQ